MMLNCIKEHLATLEAQFSKKLSNVEAKFGKGVGYKKVNNSLIFKVVTS